MTNLRKLANEFPYHPGVLTSFCGAVNTAIERDVVSTDREELLEDAYESIDRAIDLYEYPQYYLNKGRTLSKMGRYSEAIRSIETAINEENSRKTRYSIRVDRYRHKLLEVKQKQLREEIDTRLGDTREQIQGLKRGTRKELSQIEDDTRERMNEIQEETNQRADDKIHDLRTQELQFLAFFGGLITIAVSSISIASEMSFLQAGGLILILIGGFLIAFVGFTHLIPLETENDNLKSNTDWAVVVGITLVALGFALPSIASVVSTVLEFVTNT